MNILTFDFADSSGSNDHQVRPVIDGVDLLKIIEPGSLGIDPPQFFSQPELDSGGRLLIGRCSCGIVGCGDIYATVVKSDNSIIWRFKYEGEYEFEPMNYFNSIKKAAANTEWESVERTVERLVSSLDFSAIEEQGYRFEWASARISRGRVTLSFWKEDTQRLFEVGWDALNPEDAVKQVKRWAIEFS